jgi:DNA anti-recombination protein RmuC
MKFRHNCISIPLLVVSSATGVVSAYQFSGQNMKVNIVVTALAGLSAILSSIQRYCSYSERAENSKLMAKSWGRLHRKIKNTITYINSEATSINSTVFTKLVEEIQKDIEAVAQQADEMPLGLLHEIPALMTSSSESPAR